MQHSFELNQVLFITNLKEAAELPFFSSCCRCNGPAVLLQQIGVVHAGEPETGHVLLLLNPGHVLRSETAVVLSPSSYVHVKLKIWGSGIILKRLANM